MSRMNKIVSSIVLACFLLNTVVSDLAFGLAIPLTSSDIAGIQYKDMGRIKFAFEARLKGWLRAGLPINPLDIAKLYSVDNSKEQTIFNPADMQFFFREMRLVNESRLAVRARLKDNYGARDYWVLFSLSPNAEVDVYTEEQYNASSAFVKGLSQIRPEVTGEVNRYVQHERFDAILDWAHNNGAAAKPLAKNFDFSKAIASLQKALNVSITNPHDKKMVPDIEDRQFSLINLDAVRASMPGFNEKDLQDIRAHSSNNAVNVLLEKTDFEILTMSKEAFIAASPTTRGDLWYGKIQYSEDLDKAWHKVALLLAHELGAMTRMPLDDKGKNELDERAYYCGSEAMVSSELLHLTLANLDHIKGRDYAATIPGPGGNLNADQLKAIVTNPANTPQNLVNLLMKNAAFEQAPEVIKLLKDDPRLQEFERLLAEAKETTIALTNKLSKLEPGRGHIWIDRTMFMLGADGTLTATTWSESQAPSSFEYSLDSKEQLIITKKTLDEEGKENPVKPANLSIPINAAIRNVLIAHRQPKAAAPVTAAPATAIVSEAFLNELRSKTLKVYNKFTVAGISSDELEEAVEGINEHYTYIVRSKTGLSAESQQKIEDIRNAFITLLAHWIRVTDTDKRLRSSGIYLRLSEEIRKSIDDELSGWERSYDPHVAHIDCLRGAREALRPKTPTPAGNPTIDYITSAPVGDLVGKAVAGGARVTVNIQEALQAMSELDGGKKLAEFNETLAALDRLEALQDEALTAQLEIAAAGALITNSINDIRRDIPTHPNDRYNLLVISEFFFNGREELDEHRRRYGDRFDLDVISGMFQKQLMENIMAKAAGKEAKTIALIPHDLPAKYLEELTKVGIRFIRVDIRDLRYAKQDSDKERFQVDTYATMILLRQIDNNTPADSPIYRLLSFYLKTHFNFSDKIAIDDYIQAITKSDIGKLILGILAYRPAAKYDVPSYQKVAETLISA